MVTEIQRKTIKAIGSENQHFNPALANPAAKQLGINQNALSSRVGGMFMDFKELIKIVEENFPVFERRLKDKPELYRTLRSICRKMKK